jgi:hypothetical protein
MSQPHHKAELARHYFVRSQVLERRHHGSAARVTCQKAQDLYNALTPYAMREPLSLSVLNGIVAPWVW